MTLIECKNDPKKINKATIDYFLNTEIYILGSFLIALLPIWIVLARDNKNFDAFLITVIGGGVALLTGIVFRIIKFRKKYSDYTVRFSDEEIQILNGNQKIVDPKEIASIVIDRYGKLTIRTNKKEKFEIPSQIENKEEVHQFFSNLADIKSTNLNIMAITFIPLIFYGALFLARYIPTHWYYLIIGIGFLATSSFAIFSVVKHQPRKIGTWITVLIEGFFFYIVFKNMLLVIELIFGK